MRPSFQVSARVWCATTVCCSTPTDPGIHDVFGAYWPPVSVTSDTSNVAQQPPASTKHTKPVHRKQKGFSTSVSLVPHPGASVVHTPLDMCNKTGRWPALFLTLSLTLWRSLPFI